MQPSNTSMETHSGSDALLFARRDTMTKIPVILALASLAFDTTAYAATREEQTAACKGDAIRYCAFYIPNEDKISACMKKNIDRLSPRCRAMFQPAPTAKKPETAKKNPKG